MKQLTNLLHLCIGIALLAVGAYFFRTIAHEGKTWWPQQSFANSAPARSAKPAPGDPTLSAANFQMYGVLAQQNEEGSGGDAVPAPRSGAPSARDHVNAPDASAPNHFLKGRVAVETYQIYEFVVPPHALHPQLKGSFRPVTTHQNPAGSVELLLLNEQEFAGLAHNKLANSTFSADLSGRGEIHWDLNASANPQKYYLVFRNSAEGQGPGIVDADFTATFE